MDNTKKERRYRLNKNNYFSFYADVTKAFQKDCETLLLAFERANDLSFKAFSDVWKNFHFGLMFSCRDVIEEQTSFTETCFFTTKKYIVFSQNITIQVGALYMLYALYYKQQTMCDDKHTLCLGRKAKIRCTYEEFVLMSKLVERMQQRDINDAAFIFTKLKIDDAIRLVALPQVYGLEGKFLWQERIPIDNIFETVKRGNPVYNVKSTLFSPNLYGLGLLDEVSEDYARGLEKYGFPKVECDRVLDLAEDVQALCKAMEDMGKLEEEVPVRTAIKKKAFKSKVKQAR